MQVDSRGGCCVTVLRPTRVDQFFAAIGTERVIYAILLMFKADGQHMIPRDRVVGPLSRFKDEEFGH